MDDFTEVTPEEAERIKAAPAPSRGRAYSPMVVALMSGKMLHFDTSDSSRVTGGGAKTMKKLGMRVRTRRDGNGGFYAWAEKVEEVA